jgi:tripartite-type tricarboxylate transporter receptor subunit TctC
MKTVTKLASMVVLALGLGTLMPAAAESFPVKPITMIVPFPAGGPTDTVARTVGAVMSKHLKQPVIVENMAGAGGTVGAARVASAEPDGYTILLYHIGMAAAPALYPDLAYDPLKDFEYIGEVVDVPMVITARGDFPAKDFGEFLQYIRQNRNKVSYGQAGAGSASHLCGTIFMNAVQIDLRGVAFKGTGPAVNELLAGNVDFMCDQTTNTLAHIKGGKLKAYLATTATRVPSLPEVPSAQEAGLKGFDFAVWHAMYAPRGVPPANLEKLNEALRVALNDPGVKARLLDLDGIPVPPEKATSDNLRRHLAAEIVRWSTVLKRAQR